MRQSKNINIINFKREGGESAESKLLETNLWYSWCHEPVVPELGRWSPEVQDFKMILWASQVYMTPSFKKLTFKTTVNIKKC